MNSFIKPCSREPFRTTYRLMNRAYPENTNFDTFVPRNLKFHTFVDLHIIRNAENFNLISYIV